jgi:hypothetical protein
MATTTSCACADSGRSRERTVSASDRGIASSLFVQTARGGRRQRPTAHGEGEVADIPDTQRPKLHGASEAWHFGQPGPGEVNRSAAAPSRDHE